MVTGVCTQMAEFYKRAGDVLRDLEKSGGSLKSIVFQLKSGDLRTKKKLYVLLSKTLKSKCLSSYNKYTSIA